MPNSDRPSFPSFLIAASAIDVVVSVVITAGRHVRRRRSSLAFSHKALVRLLRSYGGSTCVTLLKRVDEEGETRMLRSAQV